MIITSQISQKLKQTFQDYPEVKITNDDSSVGFNVDFLIECKGEKVAVEYDSVAWHSASQINLHKNQLAEESGILLIHIREDKVPVPLTKRGQIVILSKTPSQEVSLSIGTAAEIIIKSHYRKKGVLPSAG